MLPRGPESKHVFLAVKHWGPQITRLRPRLHGAGQVFSRTSFCTDKLRLHGAGQVFVRFALPFTRDLIRTYFRAFDMRTVDWRQMCLCLELAGSNKLPRLLSSRRRDLKVSRNNNMKKGLSKDSKKPEKNFVWTDEETALLVQVIIDYKAYKAADGLDWESVKKNTRR